MPLTLTRRSKVKEVWRHPVGHHLLQDMLRRIGRSERWLLNPLVANLSLQNLDRFAGPGFSDVVVEMAAATQEYPVPGQAQRQSWWKEGVVYHIYPPSFMDSDHDGVGDLGGVLQRLPYLQRLGVDCLWLWPVLDEAPGGRGVRNFKQLRQDLGTIEEFETLCQAAHNRGMRVIVGLDVAATSDEHPWFKNALKGEKQNYYVLRPGSPDTPPNNWTRAGASVWSWLPEIKSWGLHLAGRHRMDLNWDDATVRDEMADVLEYWRQKGADGFVLDGISLLSKAGWEDGLPTVSTAGSVGYEKYAFGPRLHHYLHQLRESLPPDCFLAAETRGMGTEMAKLFTGDARGELDMILEPGHLVKPPKSRTEDGQLDLADVKAHYLDWMTHYGVENWMALFLEGPGLPRIVSRLGASGLYRATLAKLLVTMTLTLRGTPIVYQGQELGLPNTRFTSADELRDSASIRQYTELCIGCTEQEALQKVLTSTPDHARTPMPWNPGDKAGFTGARPWIRLGDGTDYLNATAQMEDAGSVWSHTRRLIAQRQKSPALVYGSFNAVFAKNRRVFCYFRILEGEKWYVEMNLTERQVPRPGRLARNQKLVLSNYDTPFKALRPYEANVYKCD